MQDPEQDYRAEFDVYARTAVFHEPPQAGSQSVAHMATFHGAFDEVVAALPDETLINKSQAIRAIDSIFTHMRYKNMLCAVWAYYVTKTGCVDARVLDNVMDLPNGYTRADVLRYARAFVVSGSD